MSLLGAMCWLSREQRKVQRQDPIGCSEQEAVKNSLGAKPTLQAESLIARELFEALLAGQHVSTLFCHGSGVFWLDSLKRYFDITRLAAWRSGSPAKRWPQMEIKAHFRFQIAKALTQYGDRRTIFRLGRVGIGNSG